MALGFWVWGLGFRVLGFGVGVGYSKPGWFMSCGASEIPLLGFKFWVVPPV